MKMRQRANSCRVAGTVVSGNQLEGGDPEDGASNLVQLMVWARQMGRYQLRLGGYFILVLDMLEDSIAAGGEAGLHVLLYALREPVPGLCVIITAGLGLGSVDTAIRDRQGLIVAWPTFLTFTKSYAPCVLIQSGFSHPSGASLRETQTIVCVDRHPRPLPAA